MPESDELRNWLALYGATGLPPAMARALVLAFGSTAEVLGATASVLAQAGLNKKQQQALQAPDWLYIDTLLEWATRPGQTILTPSCEAFPELLEAIPDPPIVLFVRGCPSHLSEAQIAIVGSRNPTTNAAQTAREFAAALADDGLAVTSGLATGIDAAAHRGALGAGHPTLAVLGCGVDVIYPKQHQRLTDEIISHGALISEYPPGTSPQAMNFPRRNRIISGLSLGVLVVEAAARSGSLITARLALEQGREVFAIPGSIHNPLSKGCHRLIRDGATLVENISDILDELGWRYPAAGGHQPRPPSAAAVQLEDLDEDYVTVLEAMGYDPASVDTLVERTGLTPQVLSSMLLNLELRGDVHPVTGVGYIRAAKPGNSIRAK